MQIKTLSIMLLGTAALAGCGASSNSAPIVYGTQPSSTGRIYNSPAESYMTPQQSQYPGQMQPQQASENAYSPASQLRSEAYGRPAPLTPVAQTVYQEPLPPAPVYVAANEADITAPSEWTQTSVAPQLMTVRPGDTVYAISRRTSVSAKDIIAENRLAPPYALNIGQTLRIPMARRMPPPTVRKVSNGLIQQPAPTQISLASEGVHLVQPGDTLYSLSRKSGVSVAMIAQINGLQPPYNLSVGDRLRLPAEANSHAPAYSPNSNVGDLTRSVSYNAPAPQPVKPAAMFDWPVKGAVIGQYGSGDLGRRNDGVNIAAPVGTPVRSAADGEVVYRGSELDGYGNLLLIKHDDGYVTAYAHNDVMLVRKGQKVRQGQVIAKVGQTGSAPEPQLHFEIRQNLKSVDPLAFLQ